MRRFVLPYLPLAAALGLCILGPLFIPLPKPLFSVPYASVLLDSDGSILNTVIAADEQWRFPPVEGALPEKYLTCLLRYEDRMFYLHPGVNPTALVRSALRNFEAGRVVQGGSTLSMQTIRLMRGNRERTYMEKCIEIFLSLKLEAVYSKNEILKLYASHAPFGGNIVGIEAASWRYFRRSPRDLSWGDAALLAVLPNNPSLIHLALNRQALKIKRNALLDDLNSAGVLDDSTHVLARAEPLPSVPVSFPREAPHLGDRLAAHGVNNAPRFFHTTIDGTLQRRVGGIVENYAEELMRSGIHNAAALITETKTGRTLAYIGNVPSDAGTDHGQEVDIITARRSPGSLLKPFLYALAMEEGRLLPDQLVPDVPMHFEGFSPRNFKFSYDGAVPASRALIRSLNVPFVYLLRDYSYVRFFDRLASFGYSFPNPADHYGLSLILGSAESSLWELTGLFSGLARGVEASTGQPFFSNTVLKDENPSMYSGSINPGALWAALETMSSLIRPAAEGSWERYRSERKIAWKTGTSMGFKDAWTIGFTPEYTVGVWIGNADSEGRPGINGLFAAAPLLFRIFRILPEEEREWFSVPYQDLVSVGICKVSGMRAGQNCPAEETRIVPRSGLKNVPCSYHVLVHLDQTGKYRVDSSVYDVGEMRHEAWFVLPPVQEWYYRRQHPEYSPMPPRLGGNAETVLAFAYPPEPGAVIRVPVELSGESGHTVFEVAHRDRGAVLFWYLDGEYIGETTAFHEMVIENIPGPHITTVIDSAGNIIDTEFTIVSE